MSNGDGENDNPSNFHLEGGIPVFNRQLDNIQSEQARANKADSEYKREQITLNRRMVWFTGLLVVCTAAGIGVSIWQARISQDSSRAATSAANTAAASLIEIQKGGSDTHALAESAKTQAEEMTKLAKRALSQAEATNRLATEARRQAEAALDNIELSERPVIGIQGNPVAEGGPVHFSFV